MMGSWLTEAVAWKKKVTVLACVRTCVRHNKSSVAVNPRNNSSLKMIYLSWVPSTFFIIGNY